MGRIAIEVRLKDVFVFAILLKRLIRVPLTFFLSISTLQLLLPHDISEELFGTLVGMVPHIFRVANPKVLVESN